MLIWAGPLTFWIQWLRNKGIYFSLRYSLSWVCLMDRWLSLQRQPGARFHPSGGSVACGYCVYLHGWGKVTASLGSSGGSGEGREGGGESVMACIPWLTYLGVTRPQVTARRTWECGPQRPTATCPGAALCLWSRTDSDGQLAVFSIKKTKNKKVFSYLFYKSTRKLLHNSLTLHE